VWAIFIMQIMSEKSDNTFQDFLPVPITLFVQSVIERGEVPFFVPAQELRYQVYPAFLRHDER
jgi:hypothetical protein